MSLKSLYNNGQTIYRVLAENGERLLVIDCIKRTMPFWIKREDITNYTQIDESILFDKSGLKTIKEDELSKRALATAHQRYSIIAPAVAFVADKKRRNEMITFASHNSNLSKQTIRLYLCLYLAFQTIKALAPIDVVRGNEITKEQKLMRWALNKYFYTSRENSLRTVYLYLLKEKYLDESGQLMKEHPSYYQFRYYYRRTKNQQNFLISRKGLTDYQRNYRPLLGEGVSEYAPNVGTAMLDSTICDIYLVDDAGNILGRPILTACVDAYSQMCCGFALTWEGGMTSLRELMNNVITNKVDYCKQYGILINDEEWDCDQLPGIMVTDRGAEYCSGTFEQLSELGVTVVNLPSYRPELKGSIEKFFDLIQSYYKPYLKGKGIIESDYQQRGAHDYRMDACLTLEDFKKVLLRCIVHYNSNRRLSSVSYTKEMLDKRIKPYSNELWNYGRKQDGANLISVDQESLRLTLLPRTTGNFSRKGLLVNGMRYKRENCTERFLKCENCVVSYDPNDVSKVWLFESGVYLEFELIERRYIHKSLDEVAEMQQKIKQLQTQGESELLQAEIDLQQHISAVGDTAKQLRTTLKVNNSV